MVSRSTKRHGGYLLWRCSSACSGLFQVQEHEQGEEYAIDHSPGQFNGEYLQGYDGDVDGEIIS